MKLNIKEKLQSYKRVMMLTKKPTREDFTLAARICAIGIVFLGIVGFLFYLVSVLSGF